MGLEYITDHRVLLFLLLSCFFITISWRQLLNPRCHGFYRFFAFEGIAFIVLLNLPFWLTNLFSTLQLISWLLLFISLVFVIQGTVLLRKLGGSKRVEANPENLAFENTVNLVSDGLYNYIRHPMYASLLLLAFGAFLKNISILSSIAVTISSVAIFITGKIEEGENIDFFGDDYKMYMKKSKMFIPFIF